MAETQAVTGFALNYTSKFEIDVTGGGETASYKEIAEGITNVTKSGNEVLDQTNYYAGKGKANTDVTGGQIILTFTGHRCYGDDAQDYIAGLENTYGETRKTKFKWTAPDGKVYTGDCTIANIETAIGDANAKADFSFEIHFNGDVEVD